MMNTHRFYIITLFLLLLGASSVIAQNYREMRQKVIEKQEKTRSEIQKLSEQIDKYEERLQLADKKYEALYQKYKDLKSLIALQDKKLEKLQNKQSQINEEIQVTTQSFKKKQKKLEQLIENHKKTLGYLYKHGRTSQLALIFSSSSINQMLVRSYYLEQFNEFREEQARNIREAKQELQRTKTQLVEARSKNENILSEIKQQKAQLAEKKQQQAKNVALLRENKQEIEEDLNRKKEQLEDFKTKLSRFIREAKELREERLKRLEAERKRKLAAAKEIEDETRRAKEVKKYSEPIKKRNFISSEELKKIERQFARQKGQLPWPVDSKTVAEHFGTRRHPVYGTKTQNPGIEIVTEPEESVQAVHKGYVIAIQPFKNYGDVVLVKHGRFITAYGNLSQIYVTKDQILQQGDTVGLSGDSFSIKGESLFFLIRENNDFLDPEKWLRSDAVSSTY
ncbi:murein hydrolase activator EnvC family protein [Fodinibius halophilus]|uniref:Peptidoglycan DD-metalloendopeptidase family protein n=1 Tax=Fodinibius halophilus TaxID=1736908 RepID=A0A6M1SZ39_9BACT|nr:peptidoglycan DD-metalloendopeptidase family protein [Fodinibius halophilus]NGP89148.1 peptidoglycan DD-metalloendopeptidase family protein [Fodinibius halophilus]